MVAEERENKRKDKPTEREVDRQSEKTSAASATFEKTSAASATFDSHEEHRENCGTCNKAKSTTSEESTDTPSSKSDFNKLSCHSLAHDPSQADAASTHNLTTSSAIQSLSAGLEKLLTLDSPFRLLAPSKPLIEEVPPPLPVEQTTQELSEVSSSGSTCSTCSSSDSESDQN